MAVKAGGGQRGTGPLNQLPAPPPPAPPAGPWVWPPPALGKRGGGTCCRDRLGGLIPTGSDLAGGRGPGCPPPRKALLVPYPPAQPQLLMPRAIDGGGHIASLTSPPPTRRTGSPQHAPQAEIQASQSPSSNGGSLPPQHPGGGKGGCPCCRGCQPQDGVGGGQCVPWGGVCTWLIQGNEGGGGTQADGPQVLHCPPQPSPQVRLSPRRKSGWGRSRGSQPRPPAPRPVSPGGAPRSKVSSRGRPRGEVTSWGWPWGRRSCRAGWGAGAPPPSVPRTGAG